LRAASIEAGFRAALIVPLLSSDGPLGTLVLQRRKPGEFPEAIVSLMQSFADQSAIALENARLFEEIAHKSRELEIASQHKSRFVANMSHELRTPLAAILGYAELMQEGFYEPLGQKSLDALTALPRNPLLRIRNLLLRPWSPSRYPSASVMSNASRRSSLTSWATPSSLPTWVRCG
jgi:signal transduction histidine kinase